LPEFWREALPGKNKDSYAENHLLLFIFCCLFFLWMPGHTAEGMTIRVVDFFTGEPIKGAVVTSNRGPLTTETPDKFVILPREAS